MAHSHSVYDSDPHFKIDPVTRAIENEESKKTVLMQNDHNSECFSFEIPRIVEGHDVTLCNQVEIHYTNADSTKQGISAGVYEVNDMIVDPDDENRVIFTWLISENATQYAGSLSFIVLFSCVENGISVYRWNTAINSSVSIAKSMNNGDAITELFPDILAQWKNELFAVATGNQLISVGPIEPDNYPYIWLDTSEYIGTNEKNVGYLTIKTGDGVSQRLYPVVKMGSIEGLNDRLNAIDGTFEELVNQFNGIIEDFNTAISNESQARSDGDNLLVARMDDIQALLTDANAAIAHSLSAKGVSVPDDMTIDEVAALIDGITMDVPTALKGIDIVTPPIKSEYYIGDTVDTTGMAVSADFGDGVIVTVTGYVVTPDVITDDTTDILVSLTVNGVTKEAYHPINVNGSTVSTLAVGSKISVTEKDGEDAWYILVDSDYHGGSLLVRDTILSNKERYLYTAASDSYATKYDQSQLDYYLSTTFYNSISEETKGLIKPTDIPVRKHANASASQVTLTRNIFALSAREWGLEGSEMEGNVVAYTDCRAIGDSYWTREPSGGMTNYAYLVSSTGERSNGTCTNANGIRPAFCVNTDQRVSTIEGGYKMVV